MKLFSSKKPQTQAAPENLANQMSKRRSRVWLALSIFLVTLVVIAAGSLLWYQKNTSAKDPNGKVQLFSIEEGDTVSGIVARLHKDGYIRSELAFKIALRIDGKASLIKAGKYRISPAENVHQILAKLESGRSDVANLSIIPGETLKEIRGSLIKLGYKEAEVDAALAKEYDHPILADKPKEASLEGYLYPDTYEIDIADKPEVVIAKSLDNFSLKLEEAGLGRDSFKAAKLNLHQAVTLGSVVEKEVNIAKDRPIVAQVFLKRLEVDMPLGSDATFVYAARQMGVQPAVDLDSPYNTRLVKGLPPGPISNMTVDVLTALVKPAKSEYLYFVTGDDNVTHFAETAAEHDANVEKYCGVRCEL